MLPLAAAVLAVAGSPIATAADGTSVYAADDELNAVWHVAPKGPPERLFDCRWPVALVTHGDTVWAACREEGVVKVWRRSEVLESFSVGAEPAALALDAEHEELYVALATGRALVVVDTRSRTVVRRRALDFEPAALAITAAGLLVVPRTGCFLLTSGFGLEPQLDVRRPMDVLDGGYIRKILGHFGADAIACHGLAAAERRGGAVVSATGISMTFETRAWSLVFELDGRRPDTDDDWSDPTGVCARDEAWAVTLRGDRAVARSEPGLVSRFPTYEPAADYERWSFQLATGAGPAGCAPTEGGWAVLSSHARTVTFITAFWTKGQAMKVVSLGRSPLPAALRKGRELFFTTDARVSDRGLSCQLCHPDGREDGLVWHTDGTPRQTPMLAGRVADTAPFNWHGTSRTLEANLQKTTERLRGTGFSPAERRALALFLREGLRPVHAQPPEDAEAVERGRALFVAPQVGCAVCHPADFAFTDGARHDVGVFSQAERDEHKRVAELRPGASLAPLRRDFDTPSLRSVGLTAPYFHDGSAATLEELLEKNGDRMGDTRELTGEQRADLAAYLRSL